MDWPTGSAPELSSDLAVADLVLRPVVAKYGTRLSSWRVHRRAVRDPGGHQFSFIFFSSRDDAQKIYKHIESNKGLKLLQRVGIVTELRNDDLEQAHRYKFSDTSDPNWPQAIQDSWPYFIHGVSATWLSLIHLNLPEESRLKILHSEEPSKREVLSVYRQVDVKLSEYWYYTGQHAFLHHLSAVFGYKPMMIQKPIQF